MRNACFILLVVVCGFSLFCCEQKTSQVKVPKKVDFNFDVRPILVQNCYLCHGPDPSSRKADLRLDTFEGATALLDDGRHPIVPGNASKSELIKRIMHEDKDAMMPPPESNLELSEYEIEVLRKWIDQGAEWKSHWAFIQPELVEPEEFDSDESNNGIDNFVLEKMESKGISPSPLADKNTLIRRVSYILTGLPPTIEKVEEFVQDESPNAYKKMVDYYLGSDAFGERWARHWMDIARYAETKGHEFDFSILGAWRYRDYLIRAFNDDVPYDQLVKEHLAGDLLDTIRWNPENGINESQLGTAFYALGEGTHSPVDIRKDEADRIDNMIDVTSKAFQGLTVSCARCHDHKFDPIPTADYYALYGVMESSRFSPKPANLTYDKVKSVEEVQTLKNEIRQLIANNWTTEELEAHIARDSKQMPEPDETSREYEVIGDFRGQNLDGWKSNGLAFGHSTTLGEPVFDDSGQLVRLDNGKASSKMLSTGIYGALRSPNFTINKDFIGLRALGNQSTIRVIIDNFQLIQNPIYGGLSKNINSEEWTDITLDVSAWKGHKAYIEILPGQYRRHIYNLPREAYVEVEYAMTYNDDWPTIPISSAPIKSKDILKDWVAQRISPDQVGVINDLLRKGQLDNRLESVDALLSKSEELTTALQDSTFFIGIDDGFGIDSHIFNRGSYQELSDEPVQRGFLSVLPGDNSFESEGSGRLELAGAILDPGNPLTSRVMVNRIWHHLFGRGIVETVDNFGLQGKLPSHPELLDYLAIKFQNEGWSIKNMIRFIVTSKTFQREVNANPKAAKQDPTNLLLSHFPLRRLESEAIWDGLLASAGNLNDEMYGKPVMVYLTDFMQGRGRPGKSGPLDGDGRRSIYQDVRRNFLQPMMLTFDRPVPFSTFGRRNVTNVPAQSLILMNDPFVVHQAEVMARHLIELEELEQADRIKYIYSRALSRYPNEEELEKASSFIKTLAQTYQVGEQDVDGNLEVWKDYCHSVFNLKEFIFLI